jgi:hypothetical protein
MDQKVLNNMKKGLRPEMIIKGVEDTINAGISPGLNFIFGNKGDNKKTIKSTVDFMLKYDDFAQKRTIRPVTPYPGSPLYYDAIEMGLLDKDNPAEDFYERKHLNSDLICCNFSELSDEEFYECLRWANSTLMKNYYDKQKTSTLAQIDHLYTEKDVSFRGFRHSQGKEGQHPVADTSKKINVKSKVIAIQGNETMDGQVNWESSPTSDADRFSQNSFNNGNKTKSTKSFDSYLKRRKLRAEEKKSLRAKKEISAN